MDDNSLFAVYDINSELYLQNYTDAGYNLRWRWTDRYSKIPLYVIQECYKFRYIDNRIPVNTGIVLCKYIIDGVGLERVRIVPIGIYENTICNEYKLLHVKSFKLIDFQ